MKSYYLIPALSVVSIMVLGCATTHDSKKDPSAVSKTNDKVVESYSRNFYGVTLSQVDKSDCRMSEKLNDQKIGQMSWKEQVHLANACVATGQWQKVELIGSLLAEGENQSPWGAYYLGLAAENSNDLDRASWMNEQALRRAPSFGLLHYQKGRISWKKLEHTSAMESLLKSVQIDPNLIEAHLFIGQIFFRDQDFGKAARHFQAVLRARPKDPTALIGLAECQIQLSDARGAIELLRRGQGYHSTDSLFFVREAYVHEQLMNDLPKAIEIYKLVQKGYADGVFKTVLDFNVGQRITDLELSVRGNRSVAGSHAGSRPEEVVK